MVDRWYLSTTILQTSDFLFLLLPKYSYFGPQGRYLLVSLVFPSDFLPDVRSNLMN